MIFDMKKKINGKSYNTDYDSVCVAKYVWVVDGWCRTKYFIFKKKSTGEYFEFFGKDSWHPGDISLISEDEAKSIIARYKSGEYYKYCAVMANMPGTRKRGYFWGKESDDPWRK